MKLKSFITMFVVSFMLMTLSSCDKQEKWEYMEITFDGTGSGWMEDFCSKDVTIDINKLNQLGQEGWEVVSMCPILETVHPNYGNKEYVTGLQPNTRTKAIKVLLKRRAQDAKKDAKPNGSTDSVLVDSVAVEEVLVVDSALASDVAPAPADSVM